MSAQYLPNYFRPCRRQAGVSQDELAALLGIRSGSIVSKYERFERIPSLKIILLYAAVFAASLADLFPAQFREARRRVAVRARLLEIKLSRLPATQSNRRKGLWLRQIIERNNQQS